MPTFDINTYVARSGAVDLDAIAWDEVPRHPLPPQAARTMRFEAAAGFASVRFLEAWMDRFVEVSPRSNGGSHGDRDR